MNKEKQIEEMAITMCKSYSGCSRCMFFHSCDVKSFAMRMYGEGYRKQRVGEWKQDFDGDYYCPFCAHYPKEIRDFCPNCGAKLGEEDEEK